jgi:hypothetical protein|tara:strand:- start:1092 stop:1247 length:156 start_codon:yes stop_codon:yes gene_type:complete
MNKQENESMQNWYKYQTLDGKMDFEDFYSRELKTQNMLLRMVKWIKMGGKK